MMGSRLFAAILVAVVSLGGTGCLFTRTVVAAAANPHHSIRGVPEVAEAAVRQGDLFLRLDTRVHDGVDVDSKSIVVRVVLKQVGAVPRPTTQSASPYWPSFARLPVHLVKPSSIPDDAELVPIERITANRLEDLESLVKPTAERVRVVVVTLSDRDNAGLRDDLALDQKAGGPVLVVVAPSDASSLQVAMTRNYEQRPRWRKAWYLATPVGVAADVVTSPIQFVLLLIGGC